MLRISVIKISSVEVVLMLEGNLTERETEELEQLRQEGDSWLEQNKRIVLDLHEVRAVDEAGITLLQQWTGENVILRAASLFLIELLGNHGIAVEQ